MDIKTYLIENIGEKRYEHSLRVVEVAIKLARLYGVDEEKAGIAGILHDCAKIRDKELLLKKSEAFGIIGDIVIEKNTELIHAPLGAEIAREVFKIEDKDILNAIRYHTTGRVGMTKLEKIIFLADYIEPMRNFAGVENVRKLVQHNLDKAVIKAMDQTINFLIYKEALISKDTIEARNDLLLK